MNEPKDWKEEDLLLLISNQVKESLTLEYKSCDALKNEDKKKDELSKDISSFANSAGGTIVYGMSEDGNNPKAIDHGYDPLELSKEWLENVITSKIQRRIDGIIINQVELPTTHPGRVAYVIVIPQSMRAPHMAADKRFYKRYNFKSVPMEEYEVRDVQHRGDVPDLLVSFNLDGSKIEFDFNNVSSPSRYSKSKSLSVSIRNLSSKPAEYAIIKLLIDSRIQIPIAYLFKFNIGTTELFNGNKIQVIKYNWSIPNDMPIWDGEEYQLGLLDLSFPYLSDSFIIGWEVKSPGMQNKHFFQTLRCDTETIKLVY